VGLLLLLLELLAVALLQPAVGRHVVVLVLVVTHRLQILPDARDLGCAPLLGRVVGWLDPAQRRPRGEQVQQHRLEEMRHLGRSFVLDKTSSRRRGRGRDGVGVRGQGSDYDGRAWRASRSSFRDATRQPGSPGRLHVTTTPKFRERSRSWASDVPSRLHATPSCPSRLLKRSQSPRYAYFPPQDSIPCPQFLLPTPSTRMASAPLSCNASASTSTTATGGAAPRG